MEIERPWALGKPVGKYKFRGRNLALLLVCPPLPLIALSFLVAAL